MKKFILHIAGLALLVYFVLPMFIDGITVTGGRAAIIAAILFAFINVAIKPLIKVITLPLNILSLGLFGLLVNILLFWFVASIIDGFNVLGFTAALLGALALTVGNWILARVL